MFSSPTRAASSAPHPEGCLDSITVGALEQVSRESGVPFERRPIERTELLAAEECGIAGTITALTIVAEVDGFHFAQSGLLSELRQRYVQIMRGASVLPGIELLPLIYESCLVRIEVRPSGDPPRYAATHKYQTAWAIRNR